MLHVCYMCDHVRVILHILAFNVFETCQTDWVLDKVRMTSEEIKQCQDLVRLYNSREAAYVGSEYQVTSSKAQASMESSQVKLNLLASCICLQWRCCLIGPGTKYFRISWPQGVMLQYCCVVRIRQTTPTCRP